MPKSVTDPGDPGAVGTNPFLRPPSPQGTPQTGEGSGCQHPHLSGELPSLPDFCCPLVPGRTRSRPGALWRRQGGREGSAGCGAGRGSEGTAALGGGVGSVTQTGQPCQDPTNPSVSLRRKGSTVLKIPLCLLRSQARRLHLHMQIICIYVNSGSNNIITVLAE